jgi:hypothetical protein
VLLEHVHLPNQEWRIDREEKQPEISQFQQIKLIRSSIANAENDEVVFLITVFLAMSGGLMAQDAGFGLRAGASIDPDQFHFGVHYFTDPLIHKLTFRPNLEIGVGSDITTVAINLEFAYSIPIPKRDFSAYIGVGPALNFYKFGDPRNDTDTDGGFNILVGMEHQAGLFGEVKVGAIGSPDLKFTIGYTFR